MGKSGWSAKRRASSPTRRRLNPDARRSELLKAALSVLRRVGPHEARVKDVTRAAGAAKGTFYLYFASWNDLLVAVRDHIVSTYAAEVRARLPAAPSIHWAAIENECVRFVDFVVELGNLHKAAFHGPIADQPISAENSADTLIAEMLTAGIAAGVCRPVKVDMAAPVLFSVLHTTADHIVQSTDRKPRIKTLLDLLREWLRPEVRE